MVFTSRTAQCGNSLMLQLHVTPHNVDSPMSTVRCDNTLSVGTGVHRHCSRHSYSSAQAGESCSLSFVVKSDCWLTLNTWESTLAILPVFYTQFSPSKFLEIVLNKNSFLKKSQPVTRKLCFCVFDLESRISIVKVVS